MDQVEGEKTDLRRRVDDLVNEVEHLQTTKFEKDEKLKLQIHRNEELLEELERMNYAVSNMREEKDMTLQLKNEKEREMENTMRIFSKT
jgi:chromosome segregation ATPase